MASVHLYALIERRPGSPHEGEPFYIGIGNAKRPTKHFVAARSKDGHYNTRLQAALDAHFALGVEPEIRILALCPDRATAFISERALIASYGRFEMDEGGILLNIASGGQGADPDMMNLPGMREKISDTTKVAINEPATRARHLAALRRVNAALTTQQRREAAEKKSPEGKARSLAALKAAHTDPEIQARRRENSREPQKNSWADPEIRARRIAAMKGKKKTMSEAGIAARQANARAPKSAEALAAMASANERNWSDPEFRAQQSRNQTAAWQDPEKRAHMLAGRSEAIANSWKNPEIRERRIAGQKASRGERSDHDLFDQPTDVAPVNTTCG